MKKMPKANKRRTRRSGSALEQINGVCGGEVNVNPTVDKSLQVSEPSNACVPPKTPEADDHMEKLEDSPSDAKENGVLHHDEMMENGKGESNGVSGELTPKTGKKGSNTETKFSGSHHKLVIGLPCRGQFEIHRSRMSSTSSKKVGEKKVLSSRLKRAQKSKEAAASPSVAANSTPVDGPKKRKKNKKKGQVREDDEYTRIKKKLRYLINRINYEQSLIDAYSLEGWKGSSMEKLRPEKELERATKEILLRKVKIRDLFQHLDALCAEGNLPETLFDSDGEISSEDIFCAKCGSKDVSLDNDIILCDGFCDRGFHQYCVKPPLLKEDIPSDEEGWLCPGCDCKDDSLDILNDSLGTKLTINDTWEKVFPEAAATLAGGDQTLINDLPSDDSDDEEYNPNGLNDDENDEDGSDDSEESENESGSSDESDFTSATDEMVESFKETKDMMDLPSDDSEDDDYDPDAPTLDEDKIQESSDSDCTSDDESNQQDEVTPLVKPAKSESDAGVDDGLVDVPSRRNVERLDYKKLYDEEYENDPSSSSDDDDWDKTAGKEDAESGDERDTVPLKKSSNAKAKAKEEDGTSTKKPRQRSQRANKKDILKEPQESPVENGGSGKKSSSSTNKQTDPKTQRLFKSFQENRYPDKAMKESLAKELEMTVTQVNNWFKNRRSSTSKPLVTMVSKEDVEKLITGKKGKGETSVGASSKQAVETELVAENKSRASESTNPGPTKRRRSENFAAKERFLQNWRDRSI